MSQPQNYQSGGHLLSSISLKTIVKLIVVLAMLMVSIVLPVASYIYGTMVGQHMAVEDLNTEATQSAFYFVASKVLGNPYYMSLANMSIAYGISLGQGDITASQFLGLAGGFLGAVVVDIALYIAYRKIDEMD